MPTGGGGGLGVEPVFLQVGLWVDQSAFWQSGEQYRAVRQRLQSFNLASSGSRYSGLEHWEQRFGVDVPVEESVSEESAEPLVCSNPHASTTEFVPSWAEASGAVMALMVGGVLASRVLEAQVKTLARSNGMLGYSRHPEL